MNAILVDKALKVIGSPQKLVNLIGRRVYQLSGARPKARPLIEETQGLQEIDIALEEIIQGKITYERYEDEETQRIQNEPKTDRFG
jgi:DNA-directed RNA polymerase subunit K/omega